MGITPMLSGEHAGRDLDTQLSSRYRRSPPLWQLSLGADGSNTEFLAQPHLQRLSDDVTYNFDYGELGVHVSIPIVQNRPIVIVQVPKHARKTASNQLLSGARLLAFGQFYVDFSQLVALFETPSCPLYKRDIFNVDKQDDGRAYRTLSSQTFAASLDKKECTGLSLYLFVMGEMTDAWLSLRSPTFPRIEFFMYSPKQSQQLPKFRRSASPSAVRNVVNPFATPAFLDYFETELKRQQSKKQTYSIPGSCLHSILDRCNTSCVTPF